MVLETFNLAPDSAQHTRILLLTKHLRMNIMALDSRIAFAEQVGAS
jgi:hypothetical protein